MLIKNEKRMKHIRKWKKWRTLICIGVLGTLLACTEQMLHDDNSPTDELTVSVARQWYDSQYAPIVMTRTCEEDGKELPVKPDWEGAKTSSWGRFETVETPILTNGVHLILDSETALHWDPCTKVDYICNTTRMVVLKDKITGKMRSFVMIFVGSYAYLKNTRNMTKNSYLYREPDYDGLVLFYAINGSFINGWRYSDGKIVGYLSPSCNTQAESFVSTRGVQQVCHDICTTEYSYNCHDEYVLVGGDMETGLIYDTVTYCDLVPYERCYRECEFVDDGKVDPNNPYPPGGAGNPEDPNKPVVEPTYVTPIKYTPSSSDHLAKKKLPTTMTTQLPNGCVIAVMEYVDNKVFNGKLNQGDLLQYYYTQHGLNIYNIGVDLDKIDGLVDCFFRTTDFLTYRSAIDAGYVVMTDIYSSISNSTHNILIVGYRSGRNLIYMDPEKGEWNVVSESSLVKNYNIVITGVK
jgi:hypothetical protein